MCSKIKILWMIVSVSLVALSYSLSSNHAVDNPVITPPLAPKHVIQIDHKNAITSPQLSTPGKDPEFCMMPNMHIDDKMCIKPHICGDEKMAIKPDALHRK